MSDSDTKEVRTEHNFASQVNTDAGFDYEADPPEDLNDPGVIPYHKPHLRPRSDGDTVFRDEEESEFDKVRREGDAMDWVKKAIDEAPERNEYDPWEKEYDESREKALKEAHEDLVERREKEDEVRAKAAVQDAKDNEKEPETKQEEPKKDTPKASVATKSKK